MIGARLLPIHRFGQLTDFPTLSRFLRATGCQILSFGMPPFGFPRFICTQHSLRTARNGVFFPSRFTAFKHPYIGGEVSNRSSGTARDSHDGGAQNGRVRSFLRSSEFRLLHGDPICSPAVLSALCLRKLITHLQWIIRREPRSTSYSPVTWIHRVARN